MAGASANLHEPDLPSEVVDVHRALVSIQEELEAIDWYNQRVVATRDTQLAAVLAHNRDEEKEHAAMVLEWLRRHDPILDRHLRAYLFTEADLVREEGIDNADASVDRGHGSLGVGSLRGEGR
jgi:ferritin-like protein